MGRISHRAGRELQDTVRKVKGLPPGGAGFAPNPYPIRLAKTTALHEQGVTQDVTLMWGDKGSEAEGVTTRDTVPAYNRNAAINADTDVLIARVGVGWEILGRPTSGVYAGGGCGGCSEPPDSMTVDLGGGLIASSDYLWSPFCNNLIIFRFVWDSGSTWNGTADTLTVECSPGVPTTFSAVLEVSSHLPAGVVATLTQGGDDWEFKNDAAWQPGQPTETFPVSGPATCDCSPFRSGPCLIPVLPVGP